MFGHLLKTICVIAGIQAALSGASVLAATLARDGQATCVIVVDDEAIAAERTAAEELASYLERIAGERPEIRNEPGDGVSVYVGRSARVDQLAPDVDWDALGSDDIVIRTVADDLILAGGRPRGALYAVYTFLQDIVGCRWYAADADEIIPRRPTLEIPELDVVYCPPFDLRQHYTEALADPLFRVKMRQNGGEFWSDTPESHGGSAHMGGAHTLLRRFLKPADHFDDNPHWYGLDRETGERRPTSVCFTDVEGQQQAAREVLQYLADNPNTPMISVSCDDRSDVCHCEACTELRTQEGGEAGPLLLFVNAVAEQVAREHPDVLVSTLAYWTTDRPPLTLRPRENVVVQLGVLDRNHKHPINRTPHFSRYLVRWSELTPYVYIWDYDPHFANFIQPHPNHFVLAESLRFYRETGVTGVFVQGAWGSTGEFMHLRAWLSSQLMWNPDQDPRALAQEFMNAYYGAAGPILLRYIDLIGAAIHREPALFLGVFSGSTAGWLTVENMNAATRLFREAEAAVAADETLLYRVRRARLSADVVWMERYRELRRTARQEGRPFLGPEDPYAEMLRLEQNEFRSSTYREWASYGDYMKRLRVLWPVRTGPMPPEAEGLRPWEWEEIQQDALTMAPDAEHGLEVDDPAASNGKALQLEGQLVGLEARYSLPAHLEGRWRVYAMVQAEPADERPSAIVATVYAPDSSGGRPHEVSRVTLECPPDHADQYRAVDLGVHRLLQGATIQVQPNAPGSHGHIARTRVDRLVLVGAQ